MSMGKDHSDRRQRGIVLHDLRHRLALHACDLRLTMGRISRGAGPVEELYGKVLARLDAGLARTLHLQGGGDGESATGDQYQEDFLKEIWGDYQRAGRLPKANCRLDIHPGHQFRIFSPALHSLLLNLLENACRAAPEGPVSLSARGGALTVTNGGEPLSEDLIRKLDRGDAPGSRGERGHGLGLILESSRELGLDLSVERIDHGTRINLTKISASSVLVIEDDPELRGMLRDYLTLEGHQVEGVSGGDVHLPGSRRFDSVVADLNLDGEKGDRLLALWKKADPDIRTIMLTGESSAASRNWPGVDRVIIKPGLRELVAALATGIGRSA